MSGLWSKILADVLFIGMNPPCPGPYFAYCSCLGLPACAGGGGSVEWYGSNPLAGAAYVEACAICVNDGSCPACGTFTVHFITDCYGNPGSYSGNLSEVRSILTRAARPIAARPTAVISVCLLSRWCAAPSAGRCFLSPGPRSMSGFRPFIVQ